MKNTSRNTIRQSSRPGAWYLALILVLLYLPIMVVVLFSFNSNSTRTANFIFEGFSLQWYGKLFDPATGYGEALKNSLLIAGMSVLLSATIGTLGAVALLRRPIRRSLKQKAAGAALSFGEQLAVLPIMIPEIILGIAFMALFSAISLPFGGVSLVLAHATFCVPYIYITVKGRIASLNPEFEEAARDLGAGPFRALWTITLPLAAPAILSGCLLAFAMSMDDLVISFFVNGPETTTLPLKVYSSVKVGVPPHVNALCTVMLATAFLLAAGGQLGSQIKDRRQKKIQSKERQSL